MVSMISPGGTWDLPQIVVNHSLVGNLFMLGAGGIVVVMLSTCFGRAPILFWFLTVSLCTAAWCGAAMKFSSFMAARIVNGFFSTVGQAVSKIYTPSRRDLELKLLLGRLDVHR